MEAAGIEPAQDSTVARRHGHEDEGVDAKMGLFGGGLSAPAVNVGL
jgi:hypothetical protein